MLFQNEFKEVSAGNYGVYAKKDNVPVPLIKVHFKGEIVGRLSKITAVQTYHNKEKNSIEAIYKFPLPENSSISSLKIQVGDKIIETEMEERSKAFDKYDKALENNDGAYLLDSERSNIFTISLGNILPDTIVNVELSFVALLETDSNYVRFSIPATIAPRYVPEESADRDGIPQENIVNPVYGLDIPYGLSINIDVNKDGVKKVASSTHNISLSLGSSYNVSFYNDIAAMDRDFLLHLEYDSDFVNSCCYAHINDETFGVVNLSLAEKTTNKEEPFEIVFLIDCSGSMDGDSIKQVKKAMDIMLRSLDTNIYFNIYRFGSSFEKMWKVSKIYNEANVGVAINYINSMNADLGGTEILAPMVDIYSLPNIDGLKRKVVFMTDGQSGDESNVINEIQKRRDIELFTIGLGYGPNDYFIKESARSGGGLGICISPAERLDAAVVRFFGRIMKNHSVKGISLNIRDADIVPNNIDIYEGVVSSVLFRIKKYVKFETIEAVGENGYSIKLPAVFTNNDFFDKLWAKEYISERESGRTDRGSTQKERKMKVIMNDIIEVSKNYNVLSTYTSMVGVEKRYASEKGDPLIVRRDVPVNIIYNESLEAPAHITPAGKKSFFGSPLIGAVGIVAGIFNNTKQACCLSHSAEEFCQETLENTNDDFLMKIYSLQMPNGLLKFDRSVLEEIGLSVSEKDRVLNLSDETEKIREFTILVISYLKSNSFYDSSWRKILNKTLKIINMQ